MEPAVKTRNKFLGFGRLAVCTIIVSLATTFVGWSTSETLRLNKSANVACTPRPLTSNERAPSLITRVPRRSTHSNFWCTNQGSTRCERDPDGSLRCQSLPSRAPQHDESNKCHTVASCILENVCLDYAKREILYHTRDGSPAHILPPSSFYYSSRCTDSSTMAIKHIRGRLPADAAWENVTGVLTSAYYHENPGHILGDEVMAIFFLLHKFGLERDTIEILLEFDARNIPRLHPYDLILHDRSQEIVDVSTLPLTCFARLAIGTSRFSYASGGFSRVELRDFRQYVLDRFGIKDVAMHPSSTKVAILTKQASDSEHPTQWNEKEFVQELARRHPDWDVAEMEWAGMSVRDQVVAFLDVDVVITLPGSMIMNAVFLREGAGVVLPCRTVAGNVEHSNEVPLLLQYQEWVQAVEFCGPSMTDVDGTNSMKANITTLMDVVEAVNDDRLQAVLKKMGLSSFT